jgi:DNA mismatch repair protein MutL
MGITKTSSNPGTTIIVKGLFKNIPARRKFLRSDLAELRHILKYFHYQAIIYPNVAFKLIVDGREKLNYTAVQDRTARLAEVFGSSFFNVISYPFINETGGYKVEGYIFGLEIAATRFWSCSTLLIGRFINDRTVKAQYQAAYEDPLFSRPESGQKVLLRLI